MQQIYKPGIASLLVLLTKLSMAQMSVTPYVFNASGGSYGNVNGYFQFEWSIGELTIVDPFANADSTLTVMNGVLQPCTDKLGRTPQMLIFSPMDYKLFPNPTKGRFELDFFVRETGRMELQLTDLSGKVLEKRTYEYKGCCRIEHFDITTHPDGMYFVIATLYPDGKRPGDNQQVVRHSGFKVFKTSGGQ
ncbi:MAG: hypothetical protein P0Y53_16130 [Candidatus Pseudobacter hemicellulosilyticus]|uniref:T9SS type A sorting domain-containing protein n=1 Tax=Candidatus Pseudobacter hemicellulosilyticus TaxID=3121375 RepID=A0AAJ5WLB7_9BACT|nr:MAG: hypothetical protein P0Y53_16130 [Pseudobacter sp.]